MDTWFEFKGINSDEMGVILTNTPAITKAPLRYNKYEVRRSSK